MSNSIFNQAALIPQMTALDKLQPFWPNTPERDLDALLESISKMGLFRPLLAFEDNGSLRLIAGERRRKALRELKQDMAPVLILPVGLPRYAVLAAGLADNYERGFNAAETVLLWNFLADYESESADGLSGYLGLKDSPKLRQWCRSAASLPDEALKALSDGRLDLELAAKMAAWKEDDLRAVLNLFNRLLPSKQKKKQWLEWLEDISRRDGLSPADILADDEFKNFDKLASQGRSAVENAARHFIWARRHPLLAELIRRREGEVKALALPSSLRLELDPSFEDLKFSFTMNFTGLTEYKTLLAILGRLQEQPEFQWLLDDSGNNDWLGGFAGEKASA